LLVAHALRQGESRRVRLWGETAGGAHGVLDAVALCQTVHAGRRDCPRDVYPHLRGGTGRQGLNGDRRGVAPAPRLPAEEREAERH
jgi:hypothetical protein